MDIVGVEVADIFLCVSVSTEYTCLFLCTHCNRRADTPLQDKEEIRNQNSVHLKPRSAVCSGNAASSDSAIMFQRHLASETFSLLCRRGAVCCLPRPGGN